MDDCIKNNEKIFVQMLYPDNYYKIDLANREIRNELIDGKFLELIYYLFYIDLPFYSILVDNKRSYFELYLSNDDLKRIIHYDLVVEINKNIYQFSGQ